MTDLPPLTLGAWLRHDFIMAEVDRVQPRSVLEMGAGRGAMGARIARRLQSVRYVAVEPDRASREVARSRLAAHGIVLEDIAEADAGEVDLLASFEVLEHIADDEGALREWSSKLRSGGALLLSVPAGADRMGPSDHAVGHLRRYDKADLERLLDAAGFDIVELRATGFPLGHGLDAARDLVARRRSSHSTHDVDERTAGSGRFLQLDAIGPLLAVISAPFRLLQRPFVDRGNSWFVSAVKRA